MVFDFRLSDFAPAASSLLALNFLADISTRIPDDPIHHPHDKLFKSAFGDPATAAGFLRWEIPSALSASIDWDHLRLEPGNFVDSHYRQSESDLLFSAPSGAWGGNGGVNGFCIKSQRKIQR